MHPSENGDMLGGVGSASSLGSTASSVFSQPRKPSLSNGLTPLTNHTDSSPQKGNSPLHAHVTAGMAATNGTESRTPVSQTNEQMARKSRPQMLPPPGKIKGYRAVWDPELDVKLSKEERKRATQRKKEFGIEVRYTFHQLLSLRKIVHMT
jgi:histone-lysine N-methyltransferase SETD1